MGLLERVFHRFLGTLGQPLACLLGRDLRRLACVALHGQLLLRCLAGPLGEAQALACLLRAALRFLARASLAV